MALDITEEMLRVVNLLASHEIEHAICGGLAVALHGAPRYTKDIDVLVKEEDLAKIEALVMEAGFTIHGGMIRFNRGKPNESRIYRKSKVNGEDLMTLDLILVTSIYQDIWNSRVTISAGPNELSVVSREGLITMKRMAGRLVDQLDIQNLTSEAK